MRVEIRISESITEPYATIYTNEITAEVSQMAALIESNANSNFITATQNERIFVLQFDEIYMVRVENEKTIIYSETRRYNSNKRLYEFENMFGKEFMRISKSTIVNLKYLNCVEPSFGGTMLLVLKNGCKDYISRKYLPIFKKYLGI